MRRDDSQLSLVVPDEPIINSATIESFAFVGEFLYAFTHGHPFGALMMVLVLLMTGRGTLLFRLFIVAILIAIIHDAITGQLWGHAT